MKLDKIGGTIALARDNHRKIKILKLLEILRQKTDEQHPMTTNQLIAELADMEIPCDRRTLSQDIATLNEAGYEVMSTMVGHEKGYYVGDRRFSIPELKIILDAIHAAAFITDKKSEELIGKVADLAGTYRSEVLKRNMVCFNTRKHSNEHIYYTVDVLEEAILTNRKVIFRYFDLNEKRERVYRRGGHHYVVEPIALVYNEDNYYLMVYSAKHDNTGTYRIDRMESVEIIEEAICEKAVALRSTMDEHTEQTFKMFAGPVEDIVLQFPPQFIGPVFDKFGEDTQMMRAGDNIIASVKVQVSPTFHGWVCQFGGELKVLQAENIERVYALDHHGTSSSGI